jgi:WD40 repeat protein
MEEAKPRSASDAEPEETKTKEKHLKSEHGSGDEIEVQELDESWESEDDDEENEENDGKPGVHEEIKEEEEELHVPVQGETHQSIRSFTGHKDAVCCIDIHPINESKILSGGCDDKAIIWNAIDGSILKVLDQNKESIAFAKFSSDGKYFATVCLDNEICVYKSESFELVKKFEGPTAEIPFIEWHSKASLLLCGSFDGTLWLYNAVSGEDIGSYVGHKGSVRAGGFTADGKLIFSAGEDMTIRTWYPLGKANTIMQKGAFQFKGTEINAAIANPQPTKGCIIAGTNEGTIIYSFIHSHKITSILDVGDTSIECIGASPCSDIDIVGCLDGKLTLIDNAVMKIRATISLDSGCVKCYVCKKEEQCFVSTTKGILYKINYKKAEIEDKFVGHAGAILDFKLNKDETLAYTASEDKTCLIYDVRHSKL